MAHFAKVEDGTVTSVVVVPDEHEADGNAYLNDLGLSGLWLRTSYNSRGGVHYGSDGEPDGSPHFRFHYAGIGYTYDDERDAFIPPKPFPSWLLDEEALWWEPPVPMPVDGGPWMWDETSESWVAS